jgi:MutS domain V
MRDEECGLLLRVESQSEPGREYRQRLESRRQTTARYDRLYGHLAIIRLVIFLAFIVLGSVALWRGSPSLWWLFLPVGSFIAAVVAHARVAEKRKRALRAVAFYENGLARIEDRWIGMGQSTEVLRDDSHLYAADLDIFGKASLFELLCTARTRAGEETLANWLAAPAVRSEILERQQAVEELRHRIDLREDLAVFGSDIRPSIHPEPMAQWGTAPQLLKSNWPRIVAVALAAAVCVTLAAAMALGSRQSLFVYYGGLVLEIVFFYFYKNRVEQMLDAVVRPQKDLQLIAQMLARLEREPFSSPHLVRVQSQLISGGVPASHQIARLTRLVDSLSLKGLDAPILVVIMIYWEIVVPVSLLVLLIPHIAFSIEKWRVRWGSSVGPWLSALGELEALCALAGYAYEHPSDPMPEVVEGGARFEGEDLRHPLIPASRCVENTVLLDKELQLLVVSGSNMSGKSTLLRTVGVNAVLALAGAPVRARSMKLSPLAIGATIRIQDSLQAGTSRFYAEILRIRHIVDSASGEIPALFLLDEILHGTNSHDRAIGAEAIVKGLIDRGAIGLVTTHDLALARVAEALSPRAANVHFEDRFIEGKLAFDYRMKPGVVEKSNALELMRAVGLKV